VIDALNEVLKDNIQFPVSECGLEALAKGFADLDERIPNVVAAVDSVVLEMKAPRRAAKYTDAKQTNVSAQFCRKGYFATTVLAYVDAQMRFLSVSISCGSSSHDGTLFSCSRVGHMLSKREGEGGIAPHWIVVGDDAFKTKGHIVTPYQKKWLSPAQKTFNYFLSKLRAVVERAFGVWKGKWGIFWRPLVVRQENIRKLVEVTCRLHNLCINRKVSCDMKDFVVADDVFWIRTCSDEVRARYLKRNRPLPPAPIANHVAHFADRATIAQLMRGLETERAQRVLRTKCMQRIEALGVPRRVAALPQRCVRVSAQLEDGDEAVEQVGDVVE
jgi:hypothetical protein